MSGIQMAMLVAGGFRGSIIAGTNGDLIGYEPAVGSIAPAPFILNGQQVLGIYDIGTTFQVFINTTGLPKGFFSQIHINGVVRLTSTSSHSNGLDYTLWSWAGRLGFVDSVSYPFFFN